MDDKSVHYRYHPPIHFQPSTPPIKTCRANDVFGASEQFIRRPFCPTRTVKGNLSGSNTVIDCSQPQVRLSWRKHVENAPVTEDNDAISQNDFPIPNHTRQRSVPVTMPSFEKTSIIAPGGLLSVDTESIILSRTPSTGNVKSNTLLGTNSAYNVVIDIKLRGPQSIGFNNRMTQSFIEDGSQHVQFHDELIGRQPSTGELPHNPTEGVHHLSLDKRSRRMQNNCRAKCNLPPKNPSSNSNVSHKLSVW